MTLFYFFYIINELLGEKIKPNVKYYTTEVEVCMAPELKKLWILLNKPSCSFPLVIQKQIPPHTHVIGWANVAVVGLVGIVKVPQRYGVNTLLWN